MYFLNLNVIKEKVQDSRLSRIIFTSMFSNFLLPISRQALHTTWPHLRILGSLDGIFPWPYLVGDNFGKLNRNFRVHLAQWSALLRLERWSTMQKNLVITQNQHKFVICTCLPSILSLIQTENEREQSPNMSLIDDAISFLFRHYLSKILKS